MIPMALFANWRLILAGVVAAGLLMGGTYLYVKGRMDAVRLQETAALKRQIAIYEHNQLVANRVIEEDRKQAEADQKAIEAYEFYVELLMRELEKPDDPCLSPRDTDRLRGLWGLRSQTPSPPTSPPK
jgi:hypothetical protein